MACVRAWAGCALASSAKQGQPTGPATASFTHAELQPHGLGRAAYARSEATCAAWELAPLLLLLLLLLLGFLRQNRGGAPERSNVATETRGGWAAGLADAAHVVSHGDHPRQLHADLRAVLGAFVWGVSWDLRLSGADRRGGAARQQQHGTYAESF